MIIVILKLESIVTALKEVLREVIVDISWNWYALFLSSGEIVVANEEKSIVFHKTEGKQIPIKVELWIEDTKS